jgi:hypothetical protein
MAIGDDFENVKAAAQKSLIATTRAINRLAAEDLPFHRSINLKVAEQLDTQNARLVSIAQRLLNCAAAGSEVNAPILNPSDVDSSWKGIVDVIDSLLERTDSSLDEFTGAVKRHEPQKDQVSGTNDNLYCLNTADYVAQVNYFWRHITHLIYYANWISSPLRRSKLRRAPVTRCYSFRI